MAVSLSIILSSCGANPKDSMTAPSDQPTSSAPVTTTPLPNMGHEQEPANSFDEQGNADAAVPSQAVDLAQFAELFAKNPIDAAYKKALDTATATSDMVSVMSDYTRVWEQEMQAAFKQLIALDDNEQYRSEQETWGRETPDVLEKIKTDALKDDGTLGAVVAAEQTMNYYRTRAERLYKQIYGISGTITYQYNDI